MHNLIISYDLRNTRDYEQVQSGINALGRNEKILESVFFVKSKYTAIKARDHLKQFIDKDDGLAVFDCSINTWATYGAKSVTLMKQLWSD